MVSYEIVPFALPERAEQLPLVKERVGRFAPVRACPDDRCVLTAEESRRSVANGRLGLVRAAYLTVYPDSRLLTLQLPTFGASEPPVNGRGKVDGMSDESRRRLMALLHSLKRSVRNPAFVTLTFPDEQIPTPRDAKKSLQTLCKRWARRFPELCAVWRLEAHPARSSRVGRPVPHFHLLVWGAWIDRFQLSRDWAEICERFRAAGRLIQDGRPSIPVHAQAYYDHLAAGTKVESIRSFRGVCSYAAKYISKQSDVSLGEDAGRVWGIFNKGCLPVGPSFVVKLTAAQAVRVCRHVRRLLYSRGVETEWMPRAIYMERPGDIMRIVEEWPE